MSDFCIESCLNKDDITRIVHDVAGNATPKTSSLIDYLSYWAKTGFTLEKKASINNFYDLRSGTRVYNNFKIKDEPSFRQVISTTLPPDIAKSMEAKESTSYVREALKSDNEYIKNSAKQSLEAYLKIISEDKDYINKIVSDNRKYDHFRSEMLDREDVTNLELSELKNLFAKYLSFFDIDLEKSGFYYFSGKTIR